MFARLYIKIEKLFDIIRINLHPRGKKKVLPGRLDPSHMGELITNVYHFRFFSKYIS
jgi:hypothetical protein